MVGDGKRSSTRFAVFAVLAALLLPCVLYGSGYVWARGTHRLVRYGFGVSHPSALIGPMGYTYWELAYLPAIYAEDHVREWIARLVPPPPVPVSMVDGS